MCVGDSLGACLCGLRQSVPHSPPPRGLWEKNKTLTEGRCSAVSFFPSRETLRKSSPVSPSGCDSSWQRNRHDDLWIPSGERVSVTQVPEVSVNVQKCQWEEEKGHAVLGKTEKMRENMCDYGLSFHLFLLGGLRGNYHKKNVTTIQDKKLFFSIMTQLNSAHIS